MATRSSGSLSYGGTERGGGLGGGRNDRDSPSKRRQPSLLGKGLEGSGDSGFLSGFVFICDVDKYIE